MQLSSGGYKAVVTPGTPVQLAAVPTNCKQVRLTAIKATGVANTSPVYIGTVGGADHRTDGTGMYAVIQPGGAININRGDNGSADALDISTLWLDGNTAGDGVLIGLSS